MAKGKVKYEYTKAANEGIKDLATDVMLGWGAGKLLGTATKGFNKGSGLEVAEKSGLPEQPSFLTNGEM